MALFVVTNMWNNLFWLIIAGKWGKLQFSPKKWEVGKIVEKGYQGRVTYVCC